VGHHRPDGDAIGSLLAFTLGLEHTKKKVTPVLVDGVPKRFRFLPGWERVQQKLPEALPLLVTIDCSDLERVGISPELIGKTPDVNIDHHPTNTQFGKVNLVDPELSATAELLYHFAADLDLDITPAVATNLLTGILADTIGFRTSSVTPKTMRVAADLIEQGAPLPEIYDRALNRRSLVSARYWARGLSRLQQEDGLVWTSLTFDDRQLVGYPGADDADLINLITTIEGAQVAVLFVEQTGGKVKVSWRSLDDTDVARLAQSFGGGGHEPAAGAMVPGTLEEVQDIILSATRVWIRRLPDGEI
jgi:phosphoesterase RecJ-like protein